MRVLRIVGIVLVILLWIAYMTASARPEPEIVKIFRTEWKVEALADLDEHLAKHKKCELAPTRDVIEKMGLYARPMDSDLKGYPIMEDWIPGTPSVVFFNIDYKWNKKEGKTFVVHEATHLIKLCGPDRYKGMRPNPRVACRMLGNVQFYSVDIDRDIRKHLGW